MKLKHVEVEVYKRPRGLNKWYLPVCSMLRANELLQLCPTNKSNWEEFDLDGCPTLCYVITTRFINHVNKLKFASGYEVISNCIGDKIMRTFFYPSWLKHNNQKAKAKAKWDLRHGKIEHNSYKTMSVRSAARLSI